MFTTVTYMFAIIFATFFILEQNRLQSRQPAPAPSPGGGGVAPGTVVPGNFLVSSTSGALTDSGYAVDDAKTTTRNLWSADRIDRSKVVINDAVIDAKSVWSSDKTLKIVDEFTRDLVIVSDPVMDGNLTTTANNGTTLVDTGVTIDDSKPASSKNMYTSMKIDNDYAKKLPPAKDGRTKPTIAGLLPDGSLTDWNVTIDDLAPASDKVVWTSLRSQRSHVQLRLEAIPMVMARVPTPLAVTVQTDLTSQWNGDGFFRPRRDANYLVTFRFFAQSPAAMTTGFLSVLMNKRVDTSPAVNTLSQFSFKMDTLFMCNGAEIVPMQRTPQQDLVFTLIATADCSVDANGVMTIQEV